MSSELRMLLETKELLLREVNQQIKQSWHLITKSQNSIHLLDIDNIHMHNSVIEAKERISPVDSLFKVTKHH